MKKEFSTRVERNEYYRNLAIDSLKGKEDTPYYVVEYKSFDDSDMEPACYKQLTAEQCEEVKAVMAECEENEIEKTIYKMFIVIFGGIAFCSRFCYCRWLTYYNYCRI